MKWLFWLPLIFLVYTFLGYPLLLWILSSVRPRTHRPARIWPTVSLVIPAYNEGARLQAKIANSLELVYPEDKREILVACDGSEPDTVSTVRSFARSGVKLVEVRERRGKHNAQMVARDASHGDILVFTDASVYLEPDALEKIIANFADASIGCVTSEDQVFTDRSSWKGEGFYVRLEMWLRRLEEGANSLVSASGSFFAARREVCRVWHPGQSSDFFLPLHAAALGLRTIMDPNCRGRYAVIPSEKAEFDRKVRTIVHGIDVVLTHRELLNPIRHGLFSWQLASHKLFRWLVPFALLLMLISCAFLSKASLFYRGLFALEVAFYATGLLALVAPRLMRFKVLKLAGFFLMGNTATLVAWFELSRGEKFVTWQPTERTGHITSRADRIADGQQEDLGVPHRGG